MLHHGRHRRPLAKGGPGWRPRCLHGLLWGHILEGGEEEALQQDCTVLSTGAPSRGSGGGQARCQSGPHGVQVLEGRAQEDG